jgi:ATP-dependent DNA helicase RecQ
MLRGYAEATGCRWQTLLAYFGERGEACGNCDNCRAGNATSTGEEAPATIVHERCGRGTVISTNGSRVVALFEEGYKTIDLEVAAESGIASLEVD